jgi:NADPH:quinone reductase-like Zn-dependent oxidoreductase
MRAIRLQAPGGPEQLVVDELETPGHGAGEALVSVHAAAITRDELGWPVDRLPATPSYEFSGVVAAIGTDVDDVSIGEPVFALSGFDRDGAAADYTVIPAAVLAPKPRTLGHVESAAIPLAALSAWQALFDHGKLAEGERVLVHGATGGVGHFAVQLAKWRGSRVIAPVSSANVETARELGADQVIDISEVRFEDVVEPVDLVFDTIGGDRLERSPAVIRRGGRVVSLAEEPPRESAISTAAFVVEPSREQLVKLATLADEGDLRPAIDRVFALADAREAFERSMSHAGRGKIVLRVADHEA